MLKIAKDVIYDILRSKVLIAYTLFLLVISFSLFALETDGAKSIVSLLSIVLIIVPLISIIFTTTIGPKHYFIGRIFRRCPFYVGYIFYWYWHSGTRLFAY